MSARPLVRFWWVVALGIAVALGSVLAVLRFQEPTYTAVARLLVTSPEAPYFRTSVERTSGTSRVTGPEVVRAAPDVDTLTAAANLYPLLIESDQVATQRERMFGPVEGEITARAIYAVELPTRFAPSDIPVIEIYADASGAGKAIVLAQQTSEAFMAWMRQSQQRAGLKPGERIDIQQILRPTEAVESGETSASMLGFIALAIVLAFGALAFALDRLLPPRDDEADEELSDSVTTPVEIERSLARGSAAAREV